jgi:1-acyl-sn-glycerol-3-phosphate acyltransferase
MEKDLKYKLINRKVEKPNPVIMTVGMWIVGILNKIYKVDFSYDYDPKSIKGQPTILLSSHASRLEFIYTIYGFGRKDINVVCGFQNILKRGLYHIFLELGVISKYLYQPDFVAIKNMFRVLKRGGAIGLFPEGIQSTSGSTHPINPATTQFIKKSKANIVVCTTNGAYLATNRYSADRKKGYIGVRYSLLFTPEMLETLTEEEIYRMLLEKIRYNDFAFNKVARNKYVGKKPNAFGINKILYKCPDCKHEHTLTVENDTIICEDCGFSVRVDEYYDLVDLRGNGCPSDIDEWYKWQRRCVVNEIKNDDFEMNLSGALYTLRYDKLRKSPNDRRLLCVGKAKLTNRGLSFQGELDGEGLDFDFPAKSLYSLTFSTKGFLEFYHNNDYYMIVPNDSDRCLIKWTLATEEIHNLYDENWKKACEDAYEYSKGDNYE